MSIHEKWDSKFPLSKPQLQEFFDTLANTPIECKTDFSYSIEILNKMGINKKDQIEFFEIYENFGGYCDCKILINVYLRISECYGIEFNLFEE